VSPLLYHQLAGLLDAGLGLGEALALLERRSRGTLRLAFGSVGDAVRAGASLADAMAVAPALFPESTRALVRAGETAGALPAVFAELAATAEQTTATRRRLVRACLYPALLFALSFFLPPVAKLVTGGVGAYLAASLLPFAVSVVVIGGLIVGGRALSRRVRLPIVGGVQAAATRERFATQLASAWRAGLAAPAAIALAGRATGDRAFAERVDEAARRVERGATLEDALAATQLLDDDFLLAVAGGERAGRIDVALATHARLLRDTWLHRLELAVQVAAIAVLVGVYAFVGWRLYRDMRALLDTGPADQLLQELEFDPSSLSPRLPPELE
jgi:type II secretory pathway component PulF